MDERERAALRTTRDKFLADRNKLDTMIAMLSEQLGEPPPAGGPGSGMSMSFAGAGGADAGSDPLAGTHEGEYFGFTSTKAAGEVLKKFGSRQHPLKTKQIFDAIRKGGVDITSEEGFYRSLARSRNFRKVARGTWGLSEWYPVAPKKGKGETDLSNVHPLQDGDEAEISDNEENPEVDTA